MMLGEGEGTSRNPLIVGGEGSTEDRAPEGLTREEYYGVSDAKSNNKGNFCKSSVMVSCAHLNPTFLKKNICPFPPPSPQLLYSLR
jgi:hypothetical protein